MSKTMRREGLALMLLALASPAAAQDPGDALTQEMAVDEPRQTWTSPNPAPCPLNSSPAPAAPLQRLELPVHGWGRELTLEIWLTGPAHTTLADESGAALLNAECNAQRCSLAVGGKTHELPPLPGGS